MSKTDKLKQRLLSRPKDFTYSEAKTLLNNMEFEESTKGKTSGSRVKFQRERDKVSLLLHKPHPGDIMKVYAVVSLIEFLEGIGEL